MVCPSKIWTREVTGKDIVDWMIDQMKNPNREETAMDRYFRSMHPLPPNPVHEWKKKQIAKHPELYR